MFVESVTDQASDMILAIVIAKDITQMSAESVMGQESELT